jgi:hypothetical protein
MDGDPGAAPSVTGSAESVAPEAACSVFDNVESLWETFRALIADQIELFALEAQRAGGSLVAIFACGIAIGVLAASVWLGLIGAMALLLIGFGLNAVAALLGVTLLNLLAIYGLARTIRQRSRDLRFPASVQALRAGTAPASSA